MADVLDYTGFEEIQSLDKLEQISRLADQQQLFEEDLEKLEKAVADKQKQLDDVQIKMLPELMKEVGQQKLTTRSGVIVEILPGFHHKIPEGKNSEAMTWLEEHGFDRIIKRAFIVLFNKKEDSAWCKKFRRDMLKRKKPLNYKETQEVHHQTLKSQIVKMIEDGIQVPKDLFGIFERPEARLQMDKK